MTARGWIRSFLSAAEAHASLPVARAKPLRPGAMRIVERDAPIDFNEDRGQYEFEILNVDAAARPGSDDECR